MRKARITVLRPEIRSPRIDFNIMTVIATRLGDYLEHHDSY
jgi:hypothetical protein